MDWRNCSMGPRTTIQDLNRTLLKTGRFSDVTFLVGREKIKEIKCHQFILMTRSSVFEVMFGDTWKNNVDVDAARIEIPDAEPEPFTTFLKFLYSNDTIEFSRPIEVLYLAHKYNVIELIRYTEEFMIRWMNVENVVATYQASQVFELPDLRGSSMSFILKNARLVVQRPEFFDLDEGTLREFAGSNELCISEVELFKVMKDWAEFQCERQQLTPDAKHFRAVLDKLITLVRFPIMPAQDFSTEVAKSDILSGHEIISIFMHLTVDSETKKRLAPLPYSSEQRTLSYPLMEQMGRASAKYSVGVYLCNEMCARDSLTYRVGPAGVLHDEDLNFSASRDIHIVGVGLYGPGWRVESPSNPLMTFDVELHLYTLFPHEGHRNILADITRCVSTRDDYEVHFKHPVPIRRDRVYHIRIGFKGEETKHGISRLSHVATSCGSETVVFNFHGPYGIGSYAPPDGRIRSILFNYP